MPKEIEREPVNFEEKLSFLRMNFSEIIDIFETIGIDSESIKATSNSASFEGITDIKSAPARFSGKPFVQVSKKMSDEVTAYANIYFDNYYTTVTAGNYRRFGVFKKENNELAKLVYEELRPFEKKWELWTKRVANWGINFLTIIFIVGLFSFGGYKDNGDMKIGVFEFSPFFVGATTAVCLTLFITDFFLKRRLPIIYNPRQTFWQKHGEASIVGIIVTVIAAMIIAYFNI